MFWTRTIKLNKPTMLISLHINFLSNNTNYKLNVIIFIKKKVTHTILGNMRGA